jgi:tRNA nucleotidyltransferase (CCA-adding enzyme)
MLSMGYKQVGKDFPVFLHPETKEEYALARKERSTGPGHTAFNFSYSPNVTLEEDLSRRDITINAIAMDDSGNLIDPFNGKDDLDNKIIRHVSDAFVEDPLRVLRVARFYSKLEPLGFEIERSTFDLLSEIILSIVHLPGERIWQEVEKVLKSDSPIPFFCILWDVLYRSGHYIKLTEETVGLPRGPSGTQYWNPEDVFKHRFNAPSYIAWPYGIGDIELNPGLESPESWWTVVALLMKGKTNIDKLNERLRVPNSYKRMSELTYELRHSYFIKYPELTFEEKIESLFKCLEKIKPSKDYIYARDIFFLAAHNILGSDILKIGQFIKDYSEIIPSEDEKKLNGNEIQKILKDRKIKLIEQELKKELD